jgi:adducin
VLPVGLDNIVTMTEEQRKFIYDAARSPPEGTVPPPLPAGGNVTDKRWRVGGLQFEALMRMLDNAVC